jgi:hypothetical protein
MKKFTLFITLLFLSNTMIVFGQNEGVKSTKLFNQELTIDNLKSIEETGLIRCGSMEYEQYLKEQNPKRFTTEEFELWLESKKTQTMAKMLDDPELYTIPIIFHVFTDGTGAENISEELIQAQVDQLNIDYRNLAGSSFDQADDAFVEFCLAQQDEDGNQLEEIGINRITDYGGGPFSDSDFESSMKAATQWDPNMYFNVWVADLSGGLLGYAQFPDNSGLPGLNTTGGAANTDGVVVLYSSVGSIANPNPNGGQYAAGRTLTHEAGHWLGLRHVWGDTSACSNDDYCDDTPDATGSNFNCPSPDSCPSDGLGPDMVENYMDYTDDTCMNTITADQVIRVRTVMENSPRRAELRNSNVCQPAQVYDLDGKINLNYTPPACGENTIYPTVDIQNNGVNTLVSCTISWNIDGQNPGSQPWTGSLAQGQSEEVSLPAMIINPGAHVLNVSLDTPNGSADENAINNTDSANVSLGYETATISLQLITDNYAEETSWEFRDDMGTVLYSYSYEEEDEATEFNHDFDVEVGNCYEFEIFDSYGDGMCCSYGEGSYTLTTAEGVVITSGGSFGSSELASIYIYETVSVKEYDFQSFSIYPNPSQGVFNIQLSSGNTEDALVQLYDVRGRLINQQSIGNQSTIQKQVDFGTVSEGVYLMKVTKGNESITQKIVIQ